MKAPLLLVFLVALFSISGTTTAWSQKPAKEFVVLATQDSVFGRTVLKYARHEKKDFLKVISDDVEHEFRMDEVSAFRLNKIDYIVKPSLHPENPVLYYTVISSGSIALFAQLCQSCHDYHYVHAELEDGSIICVNKKNYYNQLLPHLIKSPEFKEAVRNRSVRYPFFQNIATNRVASLIDLYNGLAPK